MEKDYVFRNPRDATSKTFVMLYKKLPDYYKTVLRDYPEYEAGVPAGGDEVAHRVHQQTVHNHVVPLGAYRSFLLNTVVQRSFAH